MTFALTSWNEEAGNDPCRRPQRFKKLKFSNMQKDTCESFINFRVPKIHQRVRIRLEITFSPKQQKTHLAQPKTSQEKMKNAE